MKPAAIFLSLLLVTVLCQPARGEPSPVVALPVLASSLEGRLQLAGNIEALREGDISSEVAGLVADILVDEGDIVATGQTLMKLRDGPAKWRLAETEANLKSAEAQLELKKLEQHRLEKLISTKAISQELVDQAIASTHQAEADVQARKAVAEQAKDDLARHTIIAPYNGVITTRAIEKGRWLDQGDPVFHMASLNELKIELSVPQKYFPLLNKNTRILVTSEFSSDPTEVTITRIVPFADNSRNFKVWARLPPGHWLPGMSATATLVWEGSETYPWLIPADALIRKADGSAVIWRLSNGDDAPRVEQIEVIPGPQVREQIAVASASLAEGDLVVVKGNEILRPGQQVSPTIAR